MRVLFVCTGNQCRSPMAAALLWHRLADRGCSASVASAGFVSEGVPPPPEINVAMAGTGIDISTHPSRLLHRGLVAGADLVVTMTRRQLLAVVGDWGGTWQNCFTFRELVSRVTAAPRHRDEAIRDWIARLNTGRVPRDLVALDSSDDIDDPMGGDQGTFDRTYAELSELVSQLVDGLCGAAG